MESTYAWFIRTVTVAIVHRSLHLLLSLRTVLTIPVTVPVTVPVIVTMIDTGCTHTLLLYPVSGVGCTYTSN
jgi:hypothetical protein